MCFVCYNDCTYATFRLVAVLIMSCCETECVSNVSELPNARKHCEKIRVLETSSCFEDSVDYSVFFIVRRMKVFLTDLVLTKRTKRLLIPIQEAKATYPQNTRHQIKKF